MKSINNFNIKRKCLNVYFKIQKYNLNHTKNRYRKKGNGIHHWMVGLWMLSNFILQTFQHFSIVLSDF